MKKYAVIFFLPLVMMGCFSDAHGPTIDPQTEAPTDASPSTPPPEVSPTNKVAMILRFDASREESKCFDIGIAPEITPEALLACSGYPTELTDFGGNLGKGLCGIDSVGCMASNCFCDNTKSWFFLHEVADAWEVPLQGISTFTVEVNHVIGFSWSAFDATYNPIDVPTVSSIETLCVGEAITCPAQ